MLYVQYASAAYMAQNDELVCDAYAKAEKFGGPALLDGPMLNAWAGSADTIGDAQTCGRIAERLIAEYSKDPALHSNGLHHLACALLQVGRAAEGVAHAQRALQLNPEPANRAVFEETLQRCQANNPRQPTPCKSRTWAAHVLAAVEASAPEDALRRGNEAASAGGQDWAVSAAVLRAFEVRQRDEENFDRITERARGLAQQALGWTNGAIDREALWLRERTLRLRENDLFPIDPPGPLGRRMTDEEYQQETARRGGAAVVARDPNQSADADPEVFPGSKLPRLSDYVAVMKGMQSGDMYGALAKYGLDMTSYGQLAMQWGQKLASDPTLSTQFSRLMGQ